MFYEKFGAGMHILKKPSFRSPFVFLCVLILLFFNFNKKATGAFNDVLGFNAAAEFLNKGMYLEALNAYQEIVKHSDDLSHQARALLYTGTTYGLYLDQFEAALRQFDRVLKNYQDSPAAADALFNSGMILYEMKKYKKAYGFFIEYIKKYPEGVRRTSAEV